MNYRVHQDLLPLMHPIADLKQHPMNPNNGDVDVVIEAIQMNGFADAIGVDRKTGYILEGHTRYAAILALGGTEIPVIWLDFETEAEALRHLLMHNRSNRMGKDDLGMLEQALHQVQHEQSSLMGTGFDDMFLHHLAIAQEEYLNLGEQEADEGYAKQNKGRQITCPACGHQFGGQS